MYGFFVPSIVSVCTRYGSVGDGDKVADDSKVTAVWLGELMGTFLGGQKNADDGSTRDVFIFKGLGNCCTLPRRDMDRCSVEYKLLDRDGEFPVFDND